MRTRATFQQLVANFNLPSAFRRCCAVPLLDKRTSIDPALHRSLRGNHLIRKVDRTASLSRMRLNFSNRCLLRACACGA